MTLCIPFRMFHSTEFTDEETVLTETPSAKSQNNRDLQRLFSMGVATFIVYIMLYSQPNSYIHFHNNYLPLLISLASLIILFPIMIYQLMKENGPFCTLITIPSRADFFAITSDILHHDEFIKLKGYFHHTHHIYDHVVRVAYLSYFFSKLVGLDYVSAARGGLLHDFFLYDWRVKKKKDSQRNIHGKEHPYTALRNAQLYFDINKKEADIITKHMFPKTKERPLYAESLVVSIMDKVSTVIEYVKRMVTKTHTSYKKGI